MTKKGIGGYKYNFRKHKPYCTCAYCVQKRLEQRLSKIEVESEMEEGGKVKEYKWINRLIWIILLVFLLAVGYWVVAVYGGQPLNYIGSETHQYFISGIEKIGDWLSETKENITAWLEGTDNETIRDNVEKLYILTNMERVNNGLPEFKIDLFLQDMAQQHAVDMYNSGIFEHFGFDNRSNRAVARGFNITAENIEFGTTSPETMIKDWMASMGHSANILDSNLTHIGIGIYGRYAVQMFAGY